MLPLSKKQLEVLRAIERYGRREGRMPSVRELAARLGRSAPTVQQHLDALVRKGAVAKDGTAHGLALVRADDAAKSPKGDDAAKSPKGDDAAKSPKGEEAASSPAARVSIVGRIAAGAPIDAIEHPEETLLVPGAPAGSYGLRVRGDSMVDDHILDGDVVIVRPAESVPDGAIAVCLLENDTVTLKRVYREKGRVRLQPANAQHAPLRVRNVRIRGRVFAIWRKCR